ncbi:MAG: hypothetical protein COY70_05410, partial [Candidatus Magasanikbacteria bacterium CG_4_10_14_0_8_um_filter_42_12]
KELEIEALTKDAAVKNPKMVDNWVKNVSGLVDMSGKKALWKAVGTNFAISTLTMSVPYVGAGFSAILMGRLVGEFGDNLVTKWERGEAEERVDKQMKETIELTEKCRAEADPDKRKPLRKELEDRTLVLKRLLHATAPDEDMQAIVYKEKQKGEFPEDTTIGDKDYKKGDNLPDIVRIDGDRLGNIHDIVYEAERLSPYLEEEKNKNKLGKVIESLTKNGDAMEEKQKLDLPWTEKLSKKARRLFLKYGTAVAAAGITFATVGLIRGDFAHKPTDAEIQQTIENMKKVTGVSATEAGIAKAIADHKSTPAVDSTAGKGAGRTDIAPPPRDTPAPAPTPKHPDVAPKQVEKSPDIVKKSFGESNIKENEGPWSSMHRLIEEHRTDFNMSDKEWNALVKADLKRMGIEYGPNGESKWAIGVRVFRDGDTTEYAKVELYKGTDGQPHFRLIGEEGKTIVVHDHYRIKHAPGVVEKSAVADEKNTSTNANATPNKQTQLEKSSTQPAHTKTASGDTTSPNTLDKEQALGKASGKPAGETPLAKQQERFDNALKEKGDVKQFVGGVRKDGNVMVEFQDGTKQLYPAEMLGLSAGENGELVMHIPVDASAVVHTGVVSSSGVSSGGGGGSSSYSVGAKVPEGAKFFVTPDEAVEKTAANIAERAHDSGGGVRTDDSTSDSAPRGKDVYSAKTAPTEGKPVLDSGKVAPTDTIANGEKANIYAKGLHKAVDGIRADMAATNLEKTDIVSGLELKAGIEMLKQYDLAASGEVPAVLSNNLEDVAVIKEYVIEKLSPDVQLYLGIDGGSASLEGATAVDMSPSFVEGSNNSPVIRVTMPDGKQYILLPPKDMDAFSKGPDGQLVLRRGNKFFEAELDSTGDGGFPVIKAKVRS